MTYQDPWKGKCACQVKNDAPVVFYSSASEKKAERFGIKGAKMLVANGYAYLK